MSIVTATGPISFLSAYSISPTVLANGISLNTLERLYMDATSPQTVYSAATAAPGLSNVWMPGQTEVTGGTFPDKRWIYSGPPGREPWQPTKLSEFRSAYNGIPQIMIAGLETGYALTSYPTTPTEGYALITLSGYRTDAQPNQPVYSLSAYWFYARSMANNAEGPVVAGCAPWNTWNIETSISNPHTIKYSIRDGGNRDIQSQARFYVQDLSGCGSSFDIYVDVTYP